MLSKEVSALVSSKESTVVDALGNPAHVSLSTWNMSDITVVENLLNRVSIYGSTMLTDKTYEQWMFREYLADHNVNFCIPTKNNETDPWFYDWRLYKEYYLLENLFFKLKKYRRVTTRFEKLAYRFLDFIHHA